MPYYSETPIDRQATITGNVNDNPSTEDTFNIYDETPSETIVNQRLANACFVVYRTFCTGCTF